ncbi:hypothetical protein EBZ39_17470 [bacterium]|nr:hypothetical protein [bacterium]
MDNLMSSYSNGSASASQQLLEAHEERIQRVEKEVAELATQSAEAVLKIGFLCQKVDELGNRMEEKLDSSVRDIADNVERIAHLAQKAHEATEKLSDSVQELQSINARKAENWASIKKFLFPLLIAAGSVAATELGKMAWSWLSR